VLTIDDEFIVPPPIIVSSRTNFVKNIGKSNDRVTLLLDCEKLLNQEEVDFIQNGEVSS